MNKKWDSDKGGRDAWITWLTEIMTEVYRVLKPGAHGLVWAIPRTSHYTAFGLENAGFEIRDIVHHLFGSGYPTGKHISKEFDKRENKGHKVKVTSGRGTNSTMYSAFGSGEDDGVYEDTLPESELAQMWFDWHTRLKPATEHWILVRKDVETENIADNVERYGTGALNIGATRVQGVDGYEKAWDKPVSTNIGADGYVLLTMAQHTVDLSEYKPTGRYTANLVLSHHPDCTPIDLEESSYGGNGLYNCVDECPIRQIDSSVKPTKSRKSQRGKVKVFEQYSQQWEGESTERGHNDSGGVSRYFNRFVYKAKVAPSEKRAYCPECDIVYVATKKNNDMHKPHGAIGHPTPKSIELMEFLITLITPPGGNVLDPFFGTGSTGVACQNLGFDCTGIDLDDEDAYLKIANYRLEEAA